MPGKLFAWHPPFLGLFFFLPFRKSVAIAYNLNWNAYLYMDLLNLHLPNSFFKREFALMNVSYFLYANLLLCA